MMPTLPVLVLGGTGHHGRNIVTALLARGARVRVLSRNPAAARASLGEGPEIVGGDIEERASVAAALTGASAMIVAVSAMAPALAGKLWAIEHDGVLAAFEEAKRAGVERVVFLSGYELRKALLDELDMDVGRLKLAVEEALAASDLNWTILGLPPATDMFFAMIRGDRMMVPGGGPPMIPTVSTLDVGAVAAQAALRHDLERMRFRVPGPEALSFVDAARRISTVTGRPLQVKSIPLAPLRAAAFVASPFWPYAKLLISSIRLMNRFPQDLAERVPEDHRRLHETFDYVSSTLEDDARRSLLV